jgi:hypothetical protein
LKRAFEIRVSRFVIEMYLNILNHIFKQIGVRLEGKSFVFVHQIFHGSRSRKLSRAGNK